MLLVLLMWVCESGSVVVFAHMLSIEVRLEICEVELYCTGLVHKGFALA